MRLQSAVRRAALAPAVALPLLAQAQQVELEPSAASRCLQPPAAERGVPEYPFAAWKNQEKGTVKVELEFTTPDKRPRVAVLERDGPRSLVDAVEEHVRSYRVPCLTAAETPSRLRIEFVFKPDDRRVAWSRPTDADSERRLTALRCVAHDSGKKLPAYPDDALRGQVQGRVLARLRFVAPDQPPEAEVFGQASAELLTRAIRRWVSGYRMPCLEGAPVEAIWTFVYRFEGEAFGFKPLDLLQLMGVTKDIETQRLQMDTNTMACPFDVQFQYRQPFAKNFVGELGPTDPSRRPLLDWMQGIQLNLARRPMDTVFGDTTTISVPCAKINLKPKENS